jgi:hypothetical protein
MITKAISRIIVSASLLTGFVLAMPTPAMALQSHNSNVAAVVAKDGSGKNDFGQQTSSARRHKETEKHTHKGRSGSKDQAQTRHPEPNHPETETESQG